MNQWVKGLQQSLVTRVGSPGPPRGRSEPTAPNCLLFLCCLFTVQSCLVRFLTEGSFCHACYLPGTCEGLPRPQHNKQGATQCHEAHSSSDNRGWPPRTLRRLGLLLSQNLILHFPNRWGLIISYLQNITNMRVHCTQDPPSQEREVTPGFGPGWSLLEMGKRTFHSSFQKKIGKRVLNRLFLKCGPVKYQILG